MRPCREALLPTVKKRCMSRNVIPGLRTTHAGHPLDLGRRAQFDFAPNLDMRVTADRPRLLVPPAL
jgi:hypothetical protein